MKLFIRHSWEQVFNYLRERISFVQLKILLKKNSYQSLNNIICFGYDLYATEGTYKFLKEHDVPVHFVNRICEKTNTIFDLMFTDTVDLVIDIPTRNDNLKDGFLIRRFAVEAGIPIYTSLDTAKALIDSLEKRKHGVPSLIDITKLR